MYGMQNFAFEEKKREIRKKYMHAKNACFTVGIACRAPLNEIVGNCCSYHFSQFKLNHPPVLCLCKCLLVFTKFILETAVRKPCLLLCPPDLEFMVLKITCANAKRW